MGLLIPDGKGLTDDVYNINIFQTHTIKYPKFKLWLEIIWHKPYYQVYTVDITHLFPNSLSFMLNTIPR